jgi:hypothetical protein
LLDDFGEDGTTGRFVIDDQDFALTTQNTQAAGIFVRLYVGSIFYGARFFCI